MEMRNPKKAKNIEELIDRNIHRLLISDKEYELCQTKVQEKKQANRIRELAEEITQMIKKRSEAQN